MTDKVTTTKSVGTQAQKSDTPDNKSYSNEEEAAFVPLIDSEGNVVKSLEEYEKRRVAGTL